MNIIVIFVVVAIVCGLLPQSGRSSDGMGLFSNQVFDTYMVTVT